MNTLWFTSDHHFGHKNIIKFTNRPFATLDEMDETLISKWNEKVKNDDYVYHLGDFALTPFGRCREILNLLNGRIFLIKGNHESAALNCRDRFEWIRDYYELSVEDPDAHHGQRLMVLFHYAMRVWNKSHHGAWHLYGHSHGDLPDDPTSLSFDIGVDRHDFYPISYEEVKAIMQNKKWVPPFGPRE